jgi:entericidin B
MVRNGNVLPGLRFRPELIAAASRCLLCSATVADGTWRFMMKTALAAIAFLLAASATACNTVQGVGEDMQAAGQAVDQAAEENK